MAIKAGVALIAIILGVIALFSLWGCAAKRYKVDYCGQKGCYSNAKSSYRAGQKVTLYYEIIATDTDYSFTLDGEDLDFRYDEKKGFKISFTMPDHDVKLCCGSHNSMMYEPPLLVEYGHGVCGTDGYDRGRKYSMYEFDSGHVRIEVEFTDARSVSKETYLVPYEAYERCLEVIEQNKMYEWNDKYDEEPICGGYTYVKFNHAGSIVTVNDRLPDNGYQIMYSIGSIMEEFMDSDGAEKL